MNITQTIDDSIKKEIEVIDGGKKDGGKKEEK